MVLTSRIIQQAKVPGEVNEAQWLVVPANEDTNVVTPTARLFKSDRHVMYVLQPLFLYRPILWHVDLPDRQSVKALEDVAVVTQFNDSLATPPKKATTGREASLGGQTGRQNREEYLNRQPRCWEPLEPVVNCFELPCSHKPVDFEGNSVD